MILKIYIKLNTRFRKGFLFFIFFNIDKYIFLEKKNNIL